MRVKSGEMRGVSGTGVSNGYGDRQYEGLCVLHSLLKHVFVWEEHMCECV